MEQCHIPVCAATRLAGLQSGCGPKFLKFNNAAHAPRMKSMHVINLFYVQKLTIKIFIQMRRAKFSIFNLLKSHFIIFLSVPVGVSSGILRGLSHEENTYHLYIYARSPLNKYNDLLQNLNLVHGTYGPCPCLCSLQEML